MGAFDDLIPGVSEHRDTKKEDTTYRGANAFEALVPSRHEESAQEVPPSMGERAEDFARSAVRGVGNTAIGLAGLPGDVAEYGARGINWATQKAGKALGIDVGPSREPQAPTYGSADIKKGVESLAATGKLYEPKYEAGKYGESIGEFLPYAVTGPGGIARRLATQAIIPGAASEAAGQLAQSAAPNTPWAETTARMGAAMLAPGAVSRFVTPVTTRAGREAAVRTLEHEGVDLTAGQQTGSHRLQYQESELGVGSAERFVQRQQEQFTRAALRRIGTDADRATPQVVDDAFTRIGGEFDRLSAGNTLNADQRMINDLRAAHHDYNRLVAPNQRVPAVQDAIDDVMAQLQIVGNRVTMPGDVYQTLRSRLGADARSAARDPQLQRALYEIQGALDSAMGRSITPADRAAWQRARQHYRNLLVIDRASSYAGASAAEGLISPANLRRATTAIQGMRNYTRGRGDFAELARAGAQVMTPLPNSGTAQRLRAHLVPSLISGGLGAAAGSQEGSYGALTGALTGIAIPRMLGAAALSRPGRAVLSNQVMPRSPNPYMDMLTRGLAAGIGSPAGFKKGGRVTKSFTHDIGYSKKAVDYSKGMPSAHCSICRFYRNGTCAKVRGYIKPDFWCRLFTRK